MSKFKNISINTVVYIWMNVFIREWFPIAMHLKWDQIKHSHCAINSGPMPKNKVIFWMFVKRWKCKYC